MRSWVSAGMCREGGVERAREEGRGGGKEGGVGFR